MPMAMAARCESSSVSVQWTTCARSLALQWHNNVESARSQQQQTFGAILPNALHPIHNNIGPNNNNLKICPHDDGMNEALGYRLSATKFAWLMQG